MFRTMTPRIIARLLTKGINCERVIASSQATGSHAMIWRMKVSERRALSSISTRNAGDNTTCLPISEFSEEERLVQESARRWARDKLLPKVRSMDDASTYDPAILQDLFQQGYMGMEIPEHFGGSNLNFTIACLVIEEISRVDPSVGILV